MTSIGTIIKKMITGHREANIRIDPDFVFIEDTHIQGLLLRRYYQRIYGIYIYNSKNRNITIGEEPLRKIRGHDIELYLDVEIPYPPILRGPPYPEILEARKEIEKNFIELLDMDFIRNIRHNETVEVTKPVLMTLNDGNSILGGDFRALKNYTKADRYPIPRITHALDKLENAEHIPRMDFMKFSHQNA
ncbi:hypothetical protein O181_108231 [Austropuccinia psidii MF-1]|uniref:Uncharacterized protein n=1 Tax=Austropuccinia psidii MF-1 TaxID=1389203 RepID=A0A9Q3JUD7_9BASI|nr:hypothetical protein [Austropuccinia psidii MF-1]